MRPEEEAVAAPGYIHCQGGGRIHFLPPGAYITVLSGPFLKQSAWPGVYTTLKYKAVWHDSPYGPTRNTF